MSATPVILYGASGRMGTAVRAAVPEFPDVALIICVSRSGVGTPGLPGCAWLTPDGLEAKRTFPRDAVVIDVSLPAGTRRLLDWLERSPRAFVSATTGLSQAEETRIQALARSAPILRSRNLSVGNSIVSKMLRSVPAAAKNLFELDLIEHHHAAKRDAPSGTALSWAEALSPDRPEAVNRAPDPAKPRKPGEIRIHSIRSGTATGTHRALFAGEGEMVEVVHTVTDRTVFARGALRAACFLHGKPPGNYTIEEMVESGTPE